MLRLSKNTQQFFEASKTNCLFYLRGSQLYEDTAIIIEEVNGSLSIEWSHKCAYHRLKKTRALVCAMNMKYFHVNACAFGLKSIQKKTYGMLLCKAWGFWTNNVGWQQAFGLPIVRCNKKHKTIVVTGSDTKRSP